MLHFLLVTIFAKIIRLVQNYKIKLRLINFFKEKSQFNARQHKKSGMRHYYFLNQDKIILFLIISKEIHPMNRPNSSIQFHSEKDLNPNRSLDWYALMSLLLVICFVASRLQWNPIAPSIPNRESSKCRSKFACIMPSRVRGRQQVSRDI